MFFPQYIGLDNENEVCVVGLQGCQVFATKPAQLLLKTSLEIAQSHFEGSPSVKIAFLEGKIHVFWRGSPGTIRIPGAKYHASTQGHEKTTRGNTAGKPRTWQHCKSSGRALLFPSVDWCRRQNFSGYTQSNGSGYHRRLCWIHPALDTPLFGRQRAGLILCVVATACCMKRGNWRC